jgi:threonine dehydrogenase-like Zn-dependent dehydrogenase
MKALFFDGLMPHLIETYRVPEPEENEALIRVLMAGVCATDIEIAKGYKGFRGVPGHEFVGLVERVRSPYQGLTGKRVVGEINVGCGACEFCAKGMEKHCLSRTALGISERDGAFAEFLTLPLKNLWEVPEAVSDEEAVFTEPLAAAFQVLEQVHVKPSDRVAILGDGKLGLLIAFVMARQGLNVVLAGKHASKLALAASRGIKTKYSGELQNRPGYEVVVEATGSPEGLNVAVDIVKPRGAIILKSTFASRKNGEPSECAGEVDRRAPIDLSRLVVDEITVVGSRCGPFPPALEALAAKRVDVKSLISAVYPFGDVASAFERSQEKETLKVLLDFRP